MKVSAKAEYACIAVLELAAVYQDNQPVRIKDIAEAHGIPQRFLVQILLQLKGAGYLSSTRGAAGGYQLARPPERISLGEIMRVIDGPLDAPHEPSGSSDSPALHALIQSWQEVSAVEQRMLDDISFADLVERSRQHSESMYYI